MWRESMLRLALPSGLQQLQSLTLGHVELPAAPDCIAHPKLTSLCLDSCVVDPCSDVLAWVATQLVHSTGLQCLQLHWLSRQYRDPSQAGVAAFEEALGQLQQLTCLGFKDIHGIGAAMATASSLSRLQELQLSNIGTDEQPLQMQWLPSSLTSVMLASCTVSCAAAGSSSSSGSSSWQLPVLKQLELTKSVGGFEPALLKQMPQLRVFRYYPTEGECAFWDGPPSRLEGPLVELLPQLQHLQQLQLDCLVHWPSPSSCASLTASSQLTALILMECRLPKGAVQHMFAAGRQLHQLQRIEVVASGTYQADVNHQWAERVEYNAGLLQRGSLNVGPGDLANWPAAVQGCAV
jgi:hypothetical protein